jgi:hypothetical protein
VPRLLLLLLLLLLLPTDVFAFFARPSATSAHPRAHGHDL